VHAVRTSPTSEGFTGIGLPENDIFYFHPDHLVSTSYITSKNGSISQHVEYIAFGEVLFEEHSGSFSSPYLFNGKELDRETNLSYYGARYLDMKTSLWLSLDKEGENDLSIGGYVYAFNNPVNFIDPDGNWPDPPSWKSIKAYWSYQVNTKIPNDLKKIGRELDNGWRAEKYLKGGKAGGYDFRSDLKRGEDTTGKAKKGKGDRNTQIVDITGIDVLSAYVGLSTGTKTVSKSGKIVDVVSDFAKAAKSVPDGWSLGSDTGTMIDDMINQNKEEKITMKLKHYDVLDIANNKPRAIQIGQHDTLVDASQKNKINEINKRNLKIKEREAAALSITK
jgi:RHS repeat-associated protein